MYPQGLLKGGMYAESNGEQSLTGTVPSRRPLAGPFQNHGQLD